MLKGVEKVCRDANRSAAARYVRIVFLAKIFPDTRAWDTFDAYGGRAGRHGWIHWRIHLDFRDLGSVAAHIGSERAGPLLQARAADRVVEVKDVLEGRHHRPWPAAQLVVFARGLHVSVGDADVGPYPVLQVLAHKQQARTSGAAEPLMGVAGEAI